MREPLSQLQQKIQYTFSNIAFLETAVTHRSAGMKNNERSEFLGDSILGFVIADHLFQQFPSADEGQLSRLRASLVKKETLAQIGKSLTIGNYLKLGQGELRSGGHTRDSILADAVEAIIAAIYLDAGYQKARDFIFELFRERLEQVTLEKGRKDPKTRLQEYLQSHQIDIPVYEIVEASGPQHRQQFKVSCAIKNQKLLTVGSGTSRRKAEQDAAAKMLEQYGQ
ncbi:MAG: ribonuclease III [Gammaproteobacteria bacterium]